MPATKRKTFCINTTKNLLLPNSTSYLFKQKLNRNFQPKTYFFIISKGKYLQGKERITLVTNWFFLGFIISNGNSFRPASDQTTNLPEYQSTSDIKEHLNCFLNNTCKKAAAVK